MLLTFHTGQMIQNIRLLIQTQMFYFTDNEAT
ncbi:hypothetical protein KM1_305270, partial [Entamoeba histolytica HM-3:IMSS]